MFHAPTALSAGMYDAVAVVWTKSRFLGTGAKLGTNLYRPLPARASFVSSDLYRYLVMQLFLGPCADTLIEDDDETCGLLARRYLDPWDSTSGAMSRCISR